MGKTKEKEKMDRLHDLLNELVLEGRKEDTAALRWALYILESIEKRGKK